MASVVGFDDIFNEADDALPPVFAKDHYQRANAPYAAAGGAATNSARAATESSSSTSSYIFSVTVATLVLVAVYWAYSFVNDVRRRKRDAFYQLEHRRKHGIPDDDKRPWNEAYPAALERRRPLLRRSPTKQESKSAQLDSAYDPYGRTIKDHMILEENARFERRKFQELQEEAAKAGSPTKDGFYPGPLTINRAQSILAPDANTRGRSQSPAKRGPSPEKQTRVSGIPTLRGAMPSSSSATAAFGSGAPNGASAAAKGKGRKRLYMDPREDESGHGGQSTAEETGTDEERAAAFSLPKRQRVNNWGADAPTATTNGASRIEKRQADVEADAHAAKRQRQSASASAARTGAGARKTLGSNTNGTIPIGRINRPKIDDESNGHAHPHVTFAPTPRGSSSASSGSGGPPPAPAVPSQETSTRGQKRDREETESVLAGDENESASGKPPVRKRRGTDAVASKQVNGKGKEQASTKGNRNVHSQVVEDPLCIGRKVGEVWESGNMRFKMGSDGRRLRGRYLKERIPRYHMPADSAHQDHVEMIDVVVERWYTDDEYAAAKAAGAFSWQDEPAASPATTASSTPSSAARAKMARSSSSFWDAPTSGNTSPADSPNGGEINPFARGASAGLGPVRARSSLGSPATLGMSVGAGAGRRAPSTRWQKQQAEAEAMKRFREAKLGEGKSSASAAPTTTAAASAAPNPFSAFPSSGTKDASKPTAPPLFGGAPDKKADEQKDKDALAAKPGPFPSLFGGAGAGLGATPSTTTPSTAGSTTSSTNPFAAFGPSSANSTSSTSATTPSAAAPKLSFPMPTTTTAAPATTAPSFGGPPKPFETAASKADAETKPTNGAAAAPNPFAPKAAVPSFGAGVSSTPTPSPFSFGASTKPPHDSPATGTTTTPASAPLSAKPTIPSFGSSASTTFAFGAQPAKPAESTPATPAAAPTPATSAFGSGHAPSTFNFGPDAKRTDSTASTATTAVGSSSGPQWGAGSTPKPMFGAASTTFGSTQSTQQSQPTADRTTTPAPETQNGNGTKPAGLSLADRLGPPSQQTSSTATPVPQASAFGGAFPSASAPTSVFGSAQSTSAFGSGTTSQPSSAFGAQSQSQPNPFAGPSAFGAKPDAGQGQGISLKGAASTFGSGGATFGGSAFGSNGSSAFGSQNRKWTNPDLAKKDAPASTSAFGSNAAKPNIFQTGPVEPTDGAAPKPSAFGTSKPSVFGQSSAFGANSAFGAQPTSAFGTQPAAPAAAAGADSGATSAPTPTTWASPVVAGSPAFPARPSGAPPPVARARSRSSRPPTRPPR